MELLQAQRAVPQDHGAESSILLNALAALRNGDASVRLPVDWTGTAGRIADTFNEIAELNGRTARELARLSEVVGKQGRLTQRGALGDVHGHWRDSLDAVNELIDAWVGWAASK